jgi:NADH-quinone oxidoreductase chain G
MVRKAREGVLELLLINHPLDCPVCDQGGECDLQEQTQKYGSDRGRFYESKRSVEDKECGPIVKTSMNRCIHCTKCVRFCTEICGESVLGTLGRGSNMEIGTYVENVVESEFSGNLPDICPVGALTSKPQAFRARSWELRSFETLDVIDSLGSRIRVDIRGTEILRILPSQSDDLNEDWITDRTRYCYDGLKSQRLYAPLVKINGYFLPTTWETAFLVGGHFLNSFVFNDDTCQKNTFFSLYLNKKTSIVGIFGDLVDAETLVILNDFFHNLGSSYVFYQKTLTNDIDFRSSYLLNVSLELLEKADLFIFIGLNIRLELPLINLRIRKSFLYANSLIISFGFLTSLTYQYFQQGYSINAVLNFLNGKTFVSKCLLDSKFPLILLGNNSCKNVDYNSFLKQFFILSKYSNLISSYGWFGLNIVESRISVIAAKDLGITYTSFQNSFDKKIPNFLYLCGVESSDLNFENSLFNFKIFQGHSGDSTAFSSDIIFPGCTFVEKESLYVTLEGRVQKTKFLLNPPSLARLDWKILVGFKLFLMSKQKFTNSGKFLTVPQLNTVNDIHTRLLQYSPSFEIPKFLNCYPSHKFNEFFSLFSANFFFRPCFFVYNFVFVNNSKNFFLNNSITQISKILGVCAGRYHNRQNNFFK